MQIAQTTLIDSTNSEKQIPLTIESVNGQLLIKPFEYGEQCSKDGYGHPVLIEVYQGELRVIIWSDINQEDSTHIISLEGAKEDKRIDEEDATEQQRRDEKHGLYPEREDIAN